jgi:hypothetical protein
MTVYPHAADAKPLSANEIVDLKSWPCAFPIRIGRAGVSDGVGMWWVVTTEDGDERTGDEVVEWDAGTVVGDCGVIVVRLLDKDRREVVDDDRGDDAEGLLSIA